MGMRLDIKRKLLSRTSDRVKSVDMHPTEPWLLASLYNGNVYIWNYETQALVKTFEVTHLPVRAARFVARKSWIVTGSDDMTIRIFNYNTHEKVTEFDAHQDYIRSLAVHPTLPYVLSSSDDMTIRLWDWDKGWKCVKVFEGHTHYVMSLAINPKDPNTFASACLDKTVKVWNLGSPVANYTLEGHSKGVNCVAYYYGNDKPYLASGADDCQVKVWDYQNKSCVQTLEGHAQNISAVAFHPDLPIILSTSEDGSVKIWNANTYHLENTLNYGLDRAWAVAYQAGTNNLAFGYEEGAVVIKLGREEPAVSMDAGGKLIWAKYTDILTANLKAGGLDAVADGERIPLPVKELGTCEVFPHTLQHSPNGRFIAVCGDGEYIIYTALAWRNKSFGPGSEVVWALDSSEYAVRESASKIKLFKSFKEKTQLSGPLSRLSFAVEGIFGGTLLGVRSGSFLDFYDWDQGQLVRRIEVAPKAVYWSDGGELLAIVTEEGFFILRFDRQVYQETLAEHGGVLPAELQEEGLEAAFEVIHEFPEKVESGCWIGDCFIYTNAVRRLNYVVGTQTFTIAHFDRPLYLLGYVAKDNRAYLADKDLQVVSYQLPLAVVEYQTAIVRGDFEAAETLLPAIAGPQRNRIARFLESEDLKELALEVTTDPEHQFDLALQLGQLRIAQEIAERTDTEAKWKLLGEAALTAFKLPLAETCLRKAKDLPGLLLYYTAAGSSRGLAELAELAERQGRTNIAFTCYHNLGQLDRCLAILIRQRRTAEAALFARTYLPARVADTLELWKAELRNNGKPKAAEALANPADYPNLFPEYQDALRAEGLRDERLRQQPPSPAATWPQHQDDAGFDWLALARDHAARGNGNGGSRDGHLPSLLDRPDSHPMDSFMSDNLSHASLEVNTTGTGSVRGQTDLDDTLSVHLNEEAPEDDEATPVDEEAVATELLVDGEVAEDVV
ncbi:Coatomer subunit beta' [Tieghemiomyces parasiticus]|uniref:Coatomer subunit beta' n=1 Tax=Tieghemiomyces parasiticus TaxID=78921 RepID=A0A9W8DY27_9FUNG|nr:Coatomer subunit beta' [Tieghemiomyces parasiticus]